MNAEFRGVVNSIAIAPVIPGWQGVVTQTNMEPFARIALSQSAPADLWQLLNSIGLAAVGERDRHRADFCVEFSDAPRAGHHEPPLLRITMKQSAKGTLEVDFESNSIYAAACFILSHALRLSAPLLTADADTFNVMRSVLTLARGPARIVVEGETGVGKQSLIRMVLAAAATRRIVRIDCASLHEAAADGEFAAAIKAIAAADPDGPADNAANGGILFLHRVDELSLPAQHRLLGEIHAAPVIRPRIRYLATCTRGIGELMDRGLFVPEL